LFENRSTNRFRDKHYEYIAMTYDAQITQKITDNPHNQLSTFNFNKKKLNSQSAHMKLKKINLSSWKNFSFIIMYKKHRKL